jgi:hypothetical protein
MKKLFSNNSTKIFKSKFSKLFCNKEKNGSELIINNTENDNKNIQISKETLKKIEKINDKIPLDLFNKNTLHDAIRYKVFEDSIGPAVENIKKEVPEIQGHKEFRDWVDSVIDQDKQDEVLKTNGILILRKKTDPFFKYGIDTHNYRKFHDREYEIDVEEVLNKDLFEKQRVVDDFVEQNKHIMNDLIGYYNNRFKHAQHNKFSYLIYHNGYTKKDFRLLRLNLFKNIIITTGLSTFIGFMVHPILLVLLVQRYYSILYSFHILNNSVHEIILLENKLDIIIRKFNFLGFRKEYPKQINEITNISYLGKIYNKYINIKENGWFNYLTNKFNNKGNTNNEQSSKVNNFMHFHKFKIDRKTYYIPADLSNQHPETNEELILAILNKNIKFITEYDYSKYEDRMNAIEESIEQFNKESYRKSHSVYYTKKDKLREEYSNFKNNRDYADEYYNVTLKRTDGLDGTYVDNGYR